MVYGGREASRHGGIKSMPHSAERRGFWRDTRQIPGFREGRADALQLLVGWMLQNSRAVLEINGPREVVAVRAWSRALDNAKTPAAMLQIAEAFEFERWGPCWGKVVGGILLTDSGLLSAVARSMFQRGNLSQMLWFPRRSYTMTRKMVALALAPMQPWLAEYGWHARKRWMYLARRMKAEAELVDREQREAIAQRVAEDRAEAERLQALDGKGDRE